MKKHLFFSIAGITAALFLMSPSCEKQADNEQITEVNDTSPTDEKPRVKPLSYSFEGDYEDLWHKVDSLEDDGLYQSALEVVNVIFESAKKDNNTPEVVKSVIHRMKYNSYMQEDDLVHAIYELNELSANASFPMKQILHSITAESYWQYYQQNRWQFFNRSQTVNFENKDLRTWDLNKIIDHVNKNYLMSLSSSDSLQSTNINDFEKILITYNDDERQRPTLYDFLSWRALDYFNNPEASLTRPVDKYIVQGLSYFASSDGFLHVSTESTDTMSNALYATRIYKELTAFHKDDKDPSALIDLTLKRLDYARSKSVESKKDEMYFAALNKLSEEYKSHEGYTEIRYKVASFLNAKGSSYSSENQENQWERKKAWEICKEAINKYPESFGAEQCQSLITEIEEKSIQFKGEDAYLPDSKGKMLIEYRNLDRLYFKMVKVDWDYFYDNPLYGEELMADLLKRTAVKEWTKELKNPGDFQKHSTEIAVDVPDYGQYVVLASPDQNFGLKGNAIAYSDFWASDLSYTFRRNDREGSVDVIVTHRDTGEPIPGVKATILERKYNYLTRKYDVKRRSTHRTDQLGMFTFNSTEDYRSVYVDLTYKNDHYNNSRSHYMYRPYYNDDDSYTSTHFFTDRSIYRPGQTIYFKGIRIHHRKNEHTIETGKTSKVQLFDANYQKVAELDLTTNEYGTFSGTFTAPTGVLNGRMHIKDAYGSRYFSVEEYKRPKFEVGFEKITGEYKIGQQINVKGTAKAYAGSNIDGAEVNYRITRSCGFPSWTWYRWGYYPYSATTEIQHGTLKTDENGEFTVQFTAEEDPSIDKKYSPYYSYQITADVTDVNGETHSTSQWVSVGYNSMKLNIGLDESIERNRKNRFAVYTTNLNGEKLEAKGTVKIRSLIEPEGVYRSSLWGTPDIQEFTKEEYRKLFPHDAYDNELDQTKYKKGETVLSISFNTAENDSVDFNGMNNWKPGRYIVELSSVDSFGETVTDIHYISVLDKKSTKNPTNDIWKLTALKSICEPGETAEFLISSSAKGMHVLYEIEHQGKIVQKKYIQLNAAQQVISIPIEEKHRGNLTIHFSAVKYGRLHTSKQDIYVPYSNKELDIEFETFRNKLIPGAQEEWRLKIKGPGGEKVAAEMLAAMYDASLDAFAGNSFYMSVYESYYSSKYWNSNCFYLNNSSVYTENWYPYVDIPHRYYDRLNWWGYSMGYRGYYRSYNYSYYDADDYNAEYDGVATGAVMDEVAAAPMEMAEEESMKRMDKDGRFAETRSLEAAGEKSKNEATIAGGDFSELQQQLSGERKELSNIKARTNLNETAFFYPQLETNEEGDVILKFTIPEALTRWKFIGMAHTKDLKTGYIQEEVVTQKELMVMPNAPRFFREGDKMTFTAKVSNLSEEDMNGTAQLLLFDAITMKPIDGQFQNKNSIIEFDAKRGQSARLAWNIEIPSGIGAVTYRVVAKAGKYTDGEEMAIPVLSNRMLVTESMPLPSKGIGTKEFTFEKLINSGDSKTIRHHKLTLEYTSNPAWYAIQAMPYMMEYPYECAEQIFTRYYSNSLASHIMNSSPKIKNVFESWKQSSPEAFLSNLEKNQELKSLMLEETPWVLDAQNESERKKRVALLFDLNKMDNELNRAIRKLKKMQVSNGGWPWFPGMEESRYITQHVVTGMGHLDHLGVKNVREDGTVWNMVYKAVNYLDQRIMEDYEWLKAHDPHYLTEQRISQIQVQYLYSRSYFKDISMPKRVKEAFDYYQKQAKEYWKNFDLQNEGMIALQAKRYEIPELPEMIIASIKERAILHEELGMYWKDNVGGYYWYQAPIETQALLIEAFDEVTDDAEAVEEMKVWLLKQKQTTDWKTTKATTEACYALLLKGADLLANDEQVEVRVNNQLIDPAALGADVEAGTGYFKTSWGPEAIEPEMGNVSVTRKTEGVSWGAMYWQYFEDLDKITMHETPLKLNKKLFLVQNTDSGPVITPVTENTELKPGDKVRVRIELRSDRDMEYVHMKDMRAAGFEPVNVFSRYKWQDGLGYYESTKDAATNFFMDYLPKGTYVFEYDLRVSHYGDFSNGIAQIQCMYAPEFTSHSEGIRVSIKEEEE